MDLREIVNIGNAEGEVAVNSQAKGIRFGRHSGKSNDTEEANNLLGSKRNLSGKQTEMHRRLR